MTDWSLGKFVGLLICHFGEYVLQGGNGKALTATGNATGALGVVYMRLSIKGPSFAPTRATTGISGATTRTAGTSPRTGTPRLKIPRRVQDRRVRVDGIWRTAMRL